MTREEATRIVERRARAHFACRCDATPRIRQGFVLREVARLLGEPVPSGIDMPRAVRQQPEEQPEQDLASALEASLQQNGVL